MTYTKVGLALTERFEGCSLTAYQDVGGAWTIGYGHTAGVKDGDTCTQGQADAWAAEDTQSAADDVNRLVTVPVSQEEFDALVDFQYNTGALEKSTMLRLLNSGDYWGASEEFYKWDHVKGKVVAGLLARRSAEAAEFKADLSEPQST